MYKKITEKVLIQSLINKDYRIFSEGAYDLNIIGIRSNNSKSDSFDDLICVLYKDESGIWKLEKFQATTDPGKHWLLNPMNKNGTIIMVPGQYRGAFQLGLHGISGSNPYQALRQIKPIFYVRDNNKDLNLDFSLYEKKENIFEDICNTNIHRTSSWKRVLNIGKYSAGCQVIQDPKHFQRFIELCILQDKWGHGDKFTYTLLEEKDL